MAVMMVAMLIGVGGDGVCDDGGGVYSRTVHKF